MMVRPALLLACAFLLPPHGAFGQDEPPQERPRHVILFVSDGTGPASFTLARDYLRYTTGSDALAIDAIRVGAIHTYSTDSWVTDSAAGATALSTGVKTYNGAIAVDTLRRPLATLLEAAEARGMATGLVATSRITHATPAAFAAHVPDRAMEATIAEHELAQGIDVMLGGGADFFLPASAGGRRTDERNLLDEAVQRGYTLVRNRADLATLSATPVLGLFAPSHMAYEIDRETTDQPSLAEMTAAAIDLLDDDPDGFFLLVEGSRIDHAAHANDPAAHLHDLLAYDEAIHALAFARENGTTLVVSTSDHETGGLSLGRAIDGRSIYAWRPEVLAHVTGSVDYITERLEEGADLWPILEAETGIRDLTDAERTTLQNLFDTRDAGLYNALTDLISRRAVIGWTSGGHTAVDVNLYAFGPGRDRFIGHHDNTAVGRFIASLMGFDLDALTATLRETAGSP